MTAAVMDPFWSRQPVVADLATVHALVIGVSKYDHLAGGTGSQTTKALLGGLGQLSAAATSATRVANWLRDNFDYPKVQLGSVRLLASPSPAEVPLPGGANPPPATSDEVKKAVTRWRRDARATPGNITLLFVAGHGIQTSNEGGILLLQDVGHPDSEPLDRALDVAAIRLGMVGDPTDPETWTPPVQYYFYDACRVQPRGLASYQELKAGIGSDIPRGPAPDMSWVLWGSRSRDYALADAETKTTLFSQALIECLESRAPADKDGRTVRFGLFQMTLEEVVDELAAAAEEQQSVVPGGSGQMRTPVLLRRSAAPIDREEAEREEERQEQERQEQRRSLEEGPRRRGGIEELPTPAGPRLVTVTTRIGQPRGMTHPWDQSGDRGGHRLTDRSVPRYIYGCCRSALGRHRLRSNQRAPGISFNRDRDQRAGSTATVDRRLSSGGPPARSDRRRRLGMVRAVPDLDTRRLEISAGR